MYNESIKNIERVNELYDAFIRNYEKVNEVYEQQFDNMQRMNQFTVLLYLSHGNSTKMKSVKAQLSHKLLLLFDVLDRDGITKNTDENIAIDIEPQQKVIPVRGIAVGIVILFIIS